MTDFLFYPIAFIVALGVLIVVHEFGHYWVAKRLGVKVLRFSVGFGRPLWSRRLGPDQTEFAIAAIPLGGYVKMLDETEGPVPSAERHRAFNRQPVWKRIPIVAAGPAFNFAFAILAYWLVFVIGMEGLRPIIGKVVPESPAAHAGFREGEQIVAIDGKAVQSWGQRRLYLLQRALDRDVVAVEVRDPQGQLHTRQLDLRQLPASAVDANVLERGIGLYGYLPHVFPVIGELEDGPAKRAGLQPGDRFAAIDGQPVQTWEDVVRLISARPDQATTVTVERDGRTLTVELTPHAVVQGDRTIGRINIRPQFGELPSDMRVTVRLGALEALTEAANNTWAMSVLTLDMLYRMLTLEVSAKNISGPITIAQFAGQTAKIGPLQFILFLAVISISLAVLNLLPVPLLDGGHLLFYLIEAIKGSPVSERVVAFGYRIGVVLLFGLMFLAIYNDVTRIFFQ
jgi:regulator of sigma E protease